MAQENRATIKTYFETGDVPTESQFANSFDSQVFWVDDVETDLTSNSDLKVPTVKAVVDAIPGARWTVVSSNQVAVNDGQYTNVANATYTDPSPVEGKGYWVLVRNGTATINSVGYSVAGTIVYRVFHSGAWATYYQSPFNDATSSIQTQLNSKTDTFTLFCSIGTWAAPADATTYYAPIAGALGTPITTITTFLSAFTFACKIIGIYIQHLNNGGVQGSNQNVAIQLRNHTTSTSSQLINIQTSQAANTQKNFEDYSLNVAIAANEQIALQINTPTWTPTDPTQVVLRVNLFFQRT